MRFPLTIACVASVLAAGCDGQMPATINPFKARIELSFQHAHPVEFVSGTGRTSLLCMSRVSRDGEGFIEYRAQPIDAEISHFLDEDQGYLHVNAPRATEVGIQLDETIQGCSLEAKVDVVFPGNPRGSDRAVLTLSVPALNADPADSFVKTFHGMEITSKVIHTGKRADGAVDYCASVIVGSQKGGREAELARTSNYSCRP